MSMSQDWADNTAEKLIDAGLFQSGICLILGASDTGKTTLAEALTKRLAPGQPVGIVDADIGQSHIGPPTTVGWSLADSHCSDFSQLSAAGIAFVGNVTPIGHLLQLIAAIVQCANQASNAAELIIIDTPGFISGPAACALWWTVRRLLNPKLIMAVQRETELMDIFAGLPPSGSQLELITCPPQIRTKSPDERRNYRQGEFNKYFRDSTLHNIRLSDVAVQTHQDLSRANLASCVVALRNRQGADVAVGLVKDWQRDKNIAVIRAPHLDIREVGCIIIGDVTVEIADG